MGDDPRKTVRGVGSFPIVKDMIPGGPDLLLPAGGARKADAKSGKKFANASKSGRRAGHAGPEELLADRFEIHVGAGKAARHQDVGVGCKGMNALRTREVTREGRRGIAKDCDRPIQFDCRDIAAPETVEQSAPAGSSDEVALCGSEGCDLASRAVAVEERAENAAAIPGLDTPACRIGERCDPAAVEHRLEPRVCAGKSDQTGRAIPDQQEIVRAHSITMIGV